jgi:3D (Asp-Asp-Asp) domain-containing protein
LGSFTITAYTPNEESTGKRPGDPGYRITASGAEVQEGVTIAADWRILPPGTVVYIEGIGQRVVQDRGGAIKGKRIDVFFESEQAALEWGRQKRRVYLIEWSEENEPSKKAR